MSVKLASLSGINWAEGEPANSVSFLSGTEKYYVEIEQEIDVEAEILRVTKELEYAKGFAGSIEKKLGNERFVNNAPAQVVDNERKKLADGNERIRILEQSLAELQK